MKKHIERKKMTRERFAEILKEYKFTDKQIELLWDTRPTDYLNESGIRKCAKRIAPIKDKLIQA